MNINTTKNLIILGALVIAFIGINSAEAYVPGVWEPQPRINSNEPAFYKVPNPYDAPVTPQTTGTVTMNSNSNSASNTSTTKNVTKTTNVNKSSNTTSNSSEITTPADVRDLPPVVTSDNGLTALSLAGSGSFMPSSIWQWLIVIFLILVIIIIARMLGRSRSHEVHTVTAH